MPIKPSWIERKAISEDVLKRMYASDQDMYPVPLSFERLQAWVAQSPELSVCYVNSAGQCSDSEDAVEIGAVIVLPLRKNQWEELLVGKLKEIEVDASTMFGSSDTNEPQDVGLHIFHIERFEGCDRAKVHRFAQFVLEDVREAAATRHHWNILGYSALTATPSGRRAFDRMSFEPTGYEELFAQDRSDSTEMSQKGINMLFKYPEGQGHDSPGLSQSHHIVCKSVMVARLGNGEFWDGK